MTDLAALDSLYQGKKAALAEIYRRADAEQETWRRVITVFKDRFYAPFEVDVVNQRSVLFRHDDAVLKFSYKEIGNADANSKVPESEDVLRNVLSRGEYRAFCILQILFEIEARKKNPLLIVFDDIADSFDYRNKYAIIEYIRSWQEERLFYDETLVILYPKGLRHFLNKDTDCSNNLLSSLYIHCS